MATATVALEVHPYYVGFQAMNPMNDAELLMQGDVVVLADALILTAQLRDGVFLRMPDGTPENRVNRGEPSRIVGYNVSVEAYEAEQALSFLSDRLPSKLIAEARDAVAGAARK